MTLDSRTRDLIAVGTAVGANCHPCLEHHVARAREHGIADDEIAEAIEAGKQVRQGAQAGMDALADRLLTRAPGKAAAGCGCQ